MGVEALAARHWATLVSKPCAGAPARPPARLPVSRPPSARTAWPTVSTDQRVGEHGGAARLDRHSRPLVPPPAAAPKSSDAPIPSEPAPPRQQGSPRWLSPLSLAREAYDLSTLSLAFEGPCTAPPAQNASRALLVPPGSWPATTLCNRRQSFYLSDGADRRPPVLPGRRRLRCSAGGPTSFGDLPSPGLGPLAAAPPLRLTPPTFSARRAPVTRDFAPRQGFKQRGTQITEISMPPSRHPDPSLSPLTGGCSTASAVGAQPTTAIRAKAAHPSLALTTGAPA